MTLRTISCGTEVERFTILAAIKRATQDYEVTDLVIEDILSTCAHRNLLSSIDALVFSITKEWQTIRYQDTFDLQFLDRYGMWQKHKALMIDDYEANGVNERSSKLCGVVSWNATMTFPVGTILSDIVTIFRDIKDDPHVLDMKLDGGLSSPSGLLAKIDWCKKNQNHVLGEAFVVDVECGWTTGEQAHNTVYKKYLNVVLCKIRETQRQIKEEYEEMKRRRREASRSPTRQNSNRSRLGGSRSPTRGRGGMSVVSGSSRLTLRRTITEGSNESRGSRGGRRPRMLKRTGSSDSGSSLELALKRVNSLDSTGPRRGVRPVLSPRVSRSSRQSLNPDSVSLDDYAQSLQKMLASAEMAAGVHSSKNRADDGQSERGRSPSNRKSQTTSSSASSSPTSSPHSESKGKKTRIPRSRRIKEQDRTPSPQKDTTTKSPRTVVSSSASGREDDDDAKNWRSAVDPASGDTYYYHKLTMETHWSKPTAMKDYEKRVGKVTAAAKAG